MNEHRNPTLSADGITRRDSMLGDLVQAMRGVHARRRTRRKIGAAAIMAVISISAIVLAQSQRVRPTTTAVVSGPTNRVLPNDHATPVLDPVLDMAIVKTEAGIAERYRAGASTTSIVRIDDQTLVQALAGIDRPAGLVRCGHQAWLTQPVSDADLRERAAPSDGSSSISHPWSQMFALVQPQLLITISRSSTLMTPSPVRSAAHPAGGAGQLPQAPITARRSSTLTTESPFTSPGTEPWQL